MSREKLKNKLKNWVLRKKPPKEIKILDVGCGVGDMLEVMHKAGYSNLHGVDIDDLDTERKVKINFKQVDLDKESIPFENLAEEDKFDLVFCVEVIEHLENPFKLIRDIHKVMKPNALLMMTKPHATSFWNRMTFLFTGNVIRFHPKNNHITFTTSHTFDKIIEGKFRIVKTGTEFGIIPLLRIKHPAPVWRGNTLIYEMRRIDGEEFMEKWQKRNH